MGLKKKLRSNLTQNLKLIDGGLNFLFKTITFLFTFQCKTILQSFADSCPSYRLLTDLWIPDYNHLQISASYSWISAFPATSIQGPRLSNEKL